MQALEILLLHFLQQIQSDQQVIYSVAGNHKLNLLELDLAYPTLHKLKQQVIKYLHHLLLKLQIQVYLVVEDYLPTIKTQAKLKIQICKVRETNHLEVFLVNLRQQYLINLPLIINQALS